MHRERCRSSVKGVGGCSNLQLAERVWCCASHAGAARGIGVTGAHSSTLVHSSRCKHT